MVCHTITEMPSLRRTPACKLLRRPPPALPPVCRGHQFAPNRLLRRDNRPSGCRARRWSPRLRKRPLLLGWTVLWDVLPRFLGISTQPELIGNLYRIDFLPLPKTSQGQSNPNLAAFWPRRAGRSLSSRCRCRRTRRGVTRCHIK